MGIFNFFKDKYKEFRELGEDIQYFGEDGHIKKGNIIEITRRPPLRFLFKEVTKPFYFWGGKYTFLKDIDGSEIGGENLDSKIIILNKSYVSVSKGVLTKGGKLLPADEPDNVTLDNILYLREKSDYSETPSETL